MTDTTDAPSGPLGMSTLATFRRTSGVSDISSGFGSTDASLRFYRDLLGFRVASEMSNVMIFLTATGENHHDLALLRVGDSAPSPKSTAVGLYHVAVQLADWDAVRAALEAEPAVAQVSKETGDGETVYG